MSNNNNDISPNNRWEETKPVLQQQQQQAKAPLKMGNNSHRSLLSDAGTHLNNKTGKHDLEALIEEQKQIDKRLKSLRNKCKKEMGQEEYEYRTERQTKIRLAMPTATEENPFPEYDPEDYKRIVLNIKRLDARKNTSGNNTGRTATFLGMDTHVDATTNTTFKFKDCSNE